MKQVRFLMLLAVFGIVLVFQTFAAQAYPVSGWTRYYEGLEYATGNYAGMTAWAARVSLQNPDVHTHVTPGNGGLPYETTRQTTPAFRSTWDCQVAVNASFFNMSLNPYTDNQGLVVAGGSLVSPPAGWGCISLASDKTLFFGYDTSAPASWDAVAGGNILLTWGSNIGDPTSPSTLFTIYGASGDGKYLYLIVINSCNTYVAAEWARSFGAVNAVQMDGGGSTCMSWSNLGTIIGGSRAVGVNFGIGAAQCGTTGPSVCRMNANRLDVAVRGRMNQVYVKTWTSGGGWVAPVALGDYTYDTPAIVSRADGILDVFIRGTDNTLRQRHYENGVWSGWVNWGGSLVSGPSACSMNSNNIEVVYRWADNRVWYQSYNSGVWTYGAYDIYTYDRPTVTSPQNGIIDIFYRGTDNALWYNYRDGNYVSPAFSLGGVLTSGPAACSRNSQNLEVVYRGVGNNLFYISWNSGNWTFGNLGGSIAGVPAICSMDPNSATVYVRGTDDAQYHNAWVSGVGWVGYTNQGPYY